MKSAKKRKKKKKRRNANKRKKKNNTDVAIQSDEEKEEAALLLSKLNINAEEPDAVQQSHQEVNPFIRNWSDLPEPLLLSILDHLYSIPNLYAFSAVCRSFRSTAASISLSSHPPLLLQSFDWNKTRIFILESLLGSNPLQSRFKMEIPQPFEEHPIGCSRGHVIVGGNNLYIADAITGVRIILPKFELDYAWFYRDTGILTAPISSSSCMVLLALAYHPVIAYCTLKSNEWKIIHLKTVAACLVVLRDKIFGLDSTGRCLIIIEFVDGVPSLSYKTIDLEESQTPQFSRRHLAECGGKLLMVQLYRAWLPGTTKIEIYQLDFSESVWRKIKNLGDWCLFIDELCSPIACYNPSRWAGESNHVYIVAAAAGNYLWKAFPVVDGTVMVEHMGYRYSVWVYPSILY